MRKSFEEQVRAMSSKQIIMCMLDAITNPFYPIKDFESTGECKIEKLFFGEREMFLGNVPINMAHAITKIPITVESLRDTYTRCKDLNTSYFFLETFELAMECLRKGDFDGYNLLAMDGRFAQVTRNKTYDWKYSSIGNYNYNDETTLEPYYELANVQN